MKACSTTKKNLIKLIFLIGILFFFFFGTKNYTLADIADLECNPTSNTTEERTSRPAKCNICDQNAPLTPDCATSFGVYDEISYPKSGPQEIEKTWQEEIFIDPTKITIPFVGMEERSLSSESDYITDYLEGTNEYYKNYSDLSTITNYQGILRKLTPFEYQNQEKKELIRRATEGEIHDYRVEYKGRICWDFPLWLDIGTHFFNKIIDLLPFIKTTAPEIDHFCVYASEDANSATKFIVKTINELEGLKKPLEEISKTPGFIHVDFSKGEAASISEILEHLPPDPNAENYEENFENWKNEEEGKWYRLWQAVPILSREDSQGTIKPYLAKENEKDELMLEEDTLIEGVPHLARLYEGSKQINQILIPQGKDIEMYVSEENSETTPPASCFEENFFLADKEKSDDLCCQPIIATLIAQEEFTNLYYPCQEATSSACLGNATKDVSRDFGLNLKHPYLDEIWSYTANTNGGFFNIFRPYQISPFEDIPAFDTISYSVSPGEISPEEGRFYFPHLGGVQKAKEWVVNEALRPLVSN